jgi:hypothetical protein
LELLQTLFLAFNSFGKYTEMPNAQTHFEAENLDFFIFLLGCLNKASPNHSEVYILEVEPREAA